VVEKLVQPIEVKIKQRKRLPLPVGFVEELVVGGQSFPPNGVYCIYKQTK